MKGPAKILTALLVLLLLHGPVMADHIIGGEIGYFCLGKHVQDPDDPNYDPNAPTRYDYVVQLKLYRDMRGSNFTPQVRIRIHSADGTVLINETGAALSYRSGIPLSTTVSCADEPPGLNYETGVYSASISLDSSNTGYQISYSICCRVNAISNIATSPNLGATFVCSIPPNSLFEENSSPQSADTLKLICTDLPTNFRLPFFDPDGDSLDYSFCGAYNQGLNPPYPALAYKPPYSGTNPLGGSPQITINPVTGLVTGVSGVEGNYVVTFCVREYRNGILLSTYRKEFQFLIQKCTLQKLLPASFTECRSNTVTFTHGNNPNLSYYWDFGVESQSNDTSRLRNPSFTYPDTGVYKVKMIVSRGDCADSAETQVRVYPVFKADFAPPAMRCSGQPLLLTDATTGTHFPPNAWRWLVDFPQTGAFKQAGTAKNQLYTFMSTGSNANAAVKLIVSNEKGCTDSITKNFAITPGPDLNAGPDILLCRGDSFALNVSSRGTTHQWTPGAGLSSTTIKSPVIKTTQSTQYIVTSKLNDCTNQDTVNVFVGPRPVVTARPDTTICFPSSVALYASGGDSYMWTPGVGIAAQAVAAPLASPPRTTKYVVAVKFDTGYCRLPVFDTVVVTVIPKVVINAGPRTYYVAGDTMQLRATGATFYQWTPAHLLSDPNVANPRVVLQQSQVFTIRGTTPEGCEGYGSLHVTWLAKEPDMYVPTAFTPNGDNLNETLKPVGLGVDFLEYFAVYNRLGQLLFFTKQVGHGWDGTFKGKKQPAGGYVWALGAVNYRGQVVVKKGAVTLIR